MSPNTDSRRTVLLEAVDQAEMLSRFEHNVKDTLNRIEMDLKDRHSRMERELEVQRAERTARDEKLETRLRSLEDDRTKGKGAWWILGPTIALIASACCIIVSNTALDEMRAMSQRLWSPPATVQGRKP